MVKKNFKSKIRKYTIIAFSTLAAAIPLTSSAEEICFRKGESDVPLFINKPLDQKKETEEESIKLEEKQEKEEEQPKRRNTKTQWEEIKDKLKRWYEVDLDEGDIPTLDQWESVLEHTIVYV